MINTEPPYFFMPWTWPQLDSNFRRKQISGHYSKVRHISKPISSCFFVTDVEQNLQETADGAIPEIIPIHFNYAQFSTQPATSNHSKFEGCCTPTKFLIRLFKISKCFYVQDTCIVGALRHAMLALLVQVHSKTCKTLPMMQYLKSYPFILIIGVDEYESELVILHF